MWTQCEKKWVINKLRYDHVTFTNTTLVIYLDKSVLKIKNWVVWEWKNAQKALKMLVFFFFYKM